MKQSLKRAIETCIQDETGLESTVVGQTSTPGGCINQTKLVRLDDGRKYFVKINSIPPRDVFLREAEGLEAIAKTEAIKVPRIIGHGESSAGVFLILEAVESGRRQQSFFESMGRAISQMH
ncbi:MAG: fructosamine kinase family protein, partial [Planctomycetota bacterium]